MTDTEIKHLKHLVKKGYRILYTPSAQSLGFDGAIVRRVLEIPAENSECAMLAKSPYYVNLGNGEWTDFVVVCELDKVGM